MASATPPRIEYWQPSGSSNAPLFCIMLTPDRQRHLFGRAALSRITDPLDVSHIAVWLLEESINPLGEHIYYAWGMPKTITDAIRMSWSNTAVPTLAVI
ncbi:TPA: hypothetical protein MB363_003600 [Klebsiella quasipneumoniae subsp. similipneumoniae]|nr:hypothetical protein [Klebsiella quasipneumoniae subsp. similipneumoniae]